MMQQRPPMPLRFDNREGTEFSTPTKTHTKHFGGMNTKQFGVTKPIKNTCSLGERGRLNTSNTESSSCQSSSKRSSASSISVSSVSSDESSNDTFEELGDTLCSKNVNKRAEVEGQQEQLLPDSVMFQTQQTDYGTLSADSAVKEVNMMKSSHKYSLSDPIDTKYLPTYMEDNVMKSSHKHSSSDPIDTKYLPTYMEDNVTLVTDGHLERGKTGKLYIDEESLNVISRTPEYVLSVHPDAYERVMNEAVEAQGLYSCLHGKDSANGSSHDDYVDIRVAVALVSAIMLFMGFVTYF
mmetsp:Transcript_39238/g.45788  ORF Transcript_39238/g.45788 Transcript_39238/m.45788 type:complete len:295 (-) Transcript_39238:274-1158(-)